MWNFLFQRGAKSGSPWAATELGSRVRRRQRHFAGAEPLESRALLSASGADPSPMFPQEDLPPTPAEIISIDDANSKLTSAMADIDRGLNFGLAVGDRFAEPQFSLGMNDAAFAAIAQNSPIQRVSAVSDLEHHHAFSDMFASNSERSVELRLAESGRVIAVGSSPTIQDSNGLTVSDDNAPVTYLRATDADGRTYSRLVFVTRTTRSAHSTESQTSDEVSGAIVADAELSDDSVAEELAARPDLHDFETALDSINEAVTSPTSQPNVALPLLAATTRTLRTTSTRVATSTEQDHQAGHIAAKISVEHTADDSDTTSDDLLAAPVFDPTTRNVVLSVCILGTLARANARRRRRQKAAFAQRFAAQ